MAGSGWTEVVSAVAAIAQVLAILAGGTWAYLKFVHGRILVHRAEVGVKGALLTDNGHKAIAVEVWMRNTGTTRIDLRERALYLYGAEPVFWSPIASLDWDKRMSDERKPDDPPGAGALRVTRVFERQAVIEPGERIGDNVLLPVPKRELEDDDDWLAYKVEVVVTGPPNPRLLRPSARSFEEDQHQQKNQKSRRKKRWHGTSVVPGTLKDDVSTRADPQEPVERSAM
jgi:hypothetical protein